MVPWCPPAWDPTKAIRKGSHGAPLRHKKGASYAHAPASASLGAPLPSLQVHVVLKQQLQAFNVTSVEPELLADIYRQCKGDRTLQMNLASSLLKECSNSMSDRASQVPPRRPPAHG